MHKRTKIKVAIFVLAVGMACMFAAVVTDHWAVLSPRVDKVNETCEAAHFGLWRLCKKYIYIGPENYVQGGGCGPISLPGEENCTYFKHFTPGQDAEIFDYKTQKADKRRDYLLKPAGMFYAFAGLCAFISVEVMRQSVKRMIESEDTIWIEYHYAWSFACACSAFVLLFLSGLALLVLSMPQMPRNPWETCMDAEPEQME
ncbi:hypothetical protein NHX12_018206 [Muraenolepis orangiensis]|uniref:Voltage-dependent calcium channel gamma-1 subunit n=1 Tax=Muraenolepis orangiensis TaxID=630683 RepID=A0A9Q0IXU1_9TELE|nr:hypothetical protein NHX12_018206 [Muraenolepis orangiensis]